MAVINNVNNSFSSLNAVEISVRDRVVLNAISILQSITQDNQERIATATRQNSATKLAKGFFYPNDYCKALTLTNQTARLEFFKKSGAFFHGFLPGKHFEIEDNYSHPLLVTNKTPMTFSLKRDSKPSEALLAAFEGISLIGCGEACDVAFSKALLDLFGKEKFDAIFDPKGQSPFWICHQSSKNPLVSLFFKEVRNATLDTLVKGQIVGIAGASNYVTKHPFGEAQAINLICIDDTAGSKKFIGLGLPAEGNTYDQVFEWLLQNHNQEPVEAEEILSKELSLKHLSASVSDVYEQIKPHLNNPQLGVQFKAELNLTDKEITLLLKNPMHLAEKIYKMQRNIFKTQILTQEEFKERCSRKLDVDELDYSFVEMIYQQSIPDALKSIAERMKRKN